MHVQGFGYVAGGLGDPSYMYGKSSLGRPDVPVFQLISSGTCEANGHVTIIIASLSQIHK